MMTARPRQPDPFPVTADFHAWDGLPHVGGDVSAITSKAALSCGDALEPTLAPQVGFELGKHAKHVEKGLTGRRADVDRLLRRAQGNTTGPQLMDDILQAPHRAGQTIDAGDDQRVAPGSTHEIVPPST
jgi:hypothetical protein